MSKIKLLLDAVQDVRALADSLQAVADFIQLGTASPEETSAQPVDSTPPKAYRASNHHRSGAHAAG